MRGCLISASALAIALLASPAYALDVGVGGSVGGVSVGVDVGVDSGGVSVGADVDAGGVGSVDVDASAGTGGVSGNVGAGATNPSASGTTTGGGATGTADVGDEPAGSAPSAGAPSTGAPADAAAADVTGGATPGATNRKPDSVSKTTPAKPVRKVARTMRQAIALPPRLRPSDRGRLEEKAYGYPSRLRAALPVRRGVAPALVRACRLAITSAARPLGAIRVEAVSAGAPRRVGRQVSAPLNVRIQYARQGGVETRQAKVSCNLGAGGQVIAVR